MAALGIDQLVAKHGPVAGYALLRQLRVAVRSIRGACQALVEEVDVVLEGGARLSLLRLLEMVGFDAGDLDAVAQAFDDEIEAMSKEFKTT